MGGSRLKKRVVCVVLAVALILSLAGCSNPKRDAKDTNIHQQMENGTLDISD